MPTRLLTLKAGGATGGGGPPPAVAVPVSGETNEDGDEFTITFSMPVKGFTSGDEGFVFQVDGGHTFNIAYSSGNTTSSIVFSVINPVIAFGESLILTYVPGDIETVGGAPVAHFEDFPVTNNVPPPPPVGTVGFRSLVCLPLARVRTVHV